MKYRFHKDIVYTKVAGIPLLITLRGSWDRFPAIKQVSAIQACFCQGIEQGMDEEELMDAIRMPEKMKKEKVRELYRAFLSKMAEEGYLTEEDSGDRPYPEGLQGEGS